MSILKTPCVPIFRKDGQIWLFGLKFAKKWIWVSKFQKFKSRFEISILEYYVYQFSDKMDSFEYLGPNFPENGFCHRNFKNQIMDSESTPPLYHVCQFSNEIDNIWFFDLDWGKLLNYVQYFGSNIIEGVAESWVDVDEGGCTV